MKAEVDVNGRSGLFLELSTITFAKTREEKAAEFAAKVKAGVAKLGSGPDAVEVKLRDKTKLKGYVSQVSDDSFVVAIALTDAKTGDNSEIAMANIADVKKSGISKGAKIALISIGAAVLGVFIFFKTCGNPDYCG